MSDDTKRFLAALFDGVEPGLHLLIWTLPDKVSHWHDVAELDAATASIATYAEKDVYVGAGLSATRLAANRRLTNDTAAGIVGLWADIDIADEHAHSKSNRPPDQEHAEAIIAAAGVAPTLLVHSGHGLQAWWLFAEPWLFDTADERGIAATLSTRWNLSLKVRAAELGYTIDSTFDLARVMRVPGSTNYKHEPVPVTLLKVDGEYVGTRYSPSDFDDFLVDERAASLLTGRRTHVVGALELNPSAQPDMDKLDALRDNDNRFRQSWDRTRKDMDDDSASSYDLSLATIAAATGWPDQEIANLIIASRRKHGDDATKSVRPDYIARTIARARDAESRVQSTEEIEHATERVETANATGDPSAMHHARHQLLDHLSDILGIECTKWVRFKQDPPRYRLETPGGSITIGGAETILNQTHMRAAIAAATGIVIARFKTPKWDEIAQAIFRACEDEDTGIESTDEGTAFAWLVEYLQDRPVVNVDDDDYTAACTTQTPYSAAGAMHIFGAALRKWLWLSRGERVTAARMGEVLRSFGAEHTVVSVTLGGRHTSRSVWRVPDLDGLWTDETKALGTKAT